MSFTLKLLGGVAVMDEAGPLSGPAIQRHRLALLATLAVSLPRAVSRDKVVAWLWPERDTEHARGLLNQAVYALRQALGADAVRSTGDDLHLDPTIVHVDVIAFEEALTAGDRERAVALYTGPLLDGFFLGDAPEFERWVERERGRLADAYGRALEALAESAEQTDEPSRAVEWWKRRAAHDPYDSRVAVRLMETLERAGNRAGALQHARAHLERLRADLGMAPAPDVQALVDRLQRDPVVLPRRSAAAATTKAATWTPPPEPAIEPGASIRLRRGIWLGAAVLVLVGAIGGGLRLAMHKRAATVAATPGVVDEIAQAVARELDRRAHGDTAPTPAAQRTNSIPAYELYLRGSDPVLLRSDSAARLGLDYFRRAVALDSNYAAAWAGLARMTLRVAVTGGPEATAAGRTQAEAAARRAVALDDSMAEAHAILGLMLGMSYDLPSAERHLQRAVALDPNRARLREWIAGFYLLADRPADALRQAERALAIDPLSPSATAEVARALMANDRCDEALVRLEAIAELDPPLLRAAPITATCYARQGRWTEAIALVRHHTERQDTRALPLLGYLLGRSGQRDEALAIHNRLIAQWRRGEIGAFDLTFVPAALEDRDQSFAWLDRAYTDGSLGFFPGWRVGFSGPPYDVLRADPRFSRLLARLGIQKR